MPGNSSGTELSDKRPFSHLFCQKDARFMMVLVTFFVGRTSTDEEELLWQSLIVLLKDVL